MDFAAGPFTITAIRETVIDFTTPFMEDGLGLLIPKPSQSNKMFRMFLPFRTDAWITVMAVTLGTGFLLFAFSYLSPFSAWNMMLEEAISDEVSIQENIWSVVGSFLQQGNCFSFLRKAAVRNRKLV